MSTCLFRELRGLRKITEDTGRLWLWFLWSLNPCRAGTGGGRQGREPQTSCSVLIPEALLGPASYGLGSDLVGGGVAGEGETQACQEAES